MGSDNDHMSNKLMWIEYLCIADWLLAVVSKGTRIITGLGCSLHLVPITSSALLQVGKRYSSADYIGAQRASQSAKSWTIAALVSGITIAVVIGMVFYIKASMY